MKLSEMKSNDQVLEQHLREDPAFKGEWERTALARAMALVATRFRADRGLSQRDLAKLLGMSQPQVARLERGDVNPTLETLTRVAAALDVEVSISVTPSGHAPRLLTRKARAHALAGTHAPGADVLIAAA